MNVRLAMPLIMLVTAPLLAAAPEETLISGGVTHGGFGGPSIKITQLNGQPAVMTGGRGGWIIDHTIVVGSSNYNLLTTVEVPDGTDYYLSMDYSGFELEYIHNSDKLIHYSIHTLFAPGSIHLKDEDFRRYTSNDFIYIFEPSLSITLNVVRFFRISLSGNYRLVFDVDTNYLNDEDLWGAGAALTLRFGKF